MHDDMSRNFNKSAAPTLTVDWQAYAHRLDESGMTESEKREVIEALWALVVSFIDLGFDVRTADKPCGQTDTAATGSDIGVVGSLVDHWNDATNKSGAGASSPKPPRRSM